VYITDVGNKLIQGCNNNNNNIEFLYLEADNLGILILWQFRLMVLQSKKKKFQKCLSPGPCLSSAIDSLASLLVLQHPWKKLKRLQKIQKGTLKSLNQHISKWNNLLISFAAKSIGVITKCN
jgi:hypothetical protein